MKDMNHRCKGFPKGYTDLKIEFRKEAISGWNWNLSVRDADDERFWVCYHIKFCPFCGANLDELLDETYKMLCPHITIYFENMKDIRNKVSVQCKICEKEFFLNEEKQKNG